MSDFAIGDLVRVKGCAMTMCVEDIIDVDETSHYRMQATVNTLWFDHVGQLHRDGFDPRCLERAFLQQAIVPYQGIVR